MTPKDGDVVVKGKKGLDAFPGTTLEEELKARGIETVALAGFLTNCCVESTMRTAYEKGFNVITLTDCVATTSEEGQKAATTGTYGMFSSPMTSGEFKEKLAENGAESEDNSPAILYNLIERMGKKKVRSVAEKKADNKGSAAARPVEADPKRAQFAA